MLPRCCGTMGQCLQKRFAIRGIIQVPAGPNDASALQPRSIQIWAMATRPRWRQIHTTAGTRLDERLAYPGVEPYFLVDRFAAGVELLGVLAFRFLE